MAQSQDRRCRYIAHQGQSLTVGAWAEQRNISPRVLSERLSKGWPIERALTYPCRKGYLQGRAEQLAKGRAWWRANGQAWRERRR
ncbi:hypothetical protein KBY83_05855 [Cyanobium sp. WKJ7-Wakatipu]|uniref:hypothetical protein n=1 Tax=Cyanobium sp. WKJ7-Wakatipu TaxID=2823726 RepID=UPI0020CF3671|nr:hypothetical protein [Cyanobium sp. WKJ7-Wakatipu]MCP9782846.1 hypothetical protein [Cyanobium sp. WKJ7-Wakatipu]